MSEKKKALLQPTRYVSLKHAYCRAQYKYTELMRHWLNAQKKKKKSKLQEFTPKNTTTRIVGKGDPKRRKRRRHWRWGRGGNDFPVGNILAWRL